MFFSEPILLKKGPLAKVWLAAHWERKMNKSQFIQTNITNSVNALVSGDQPPLALRISGQLLLGITKIYSRKAKYLLEDCAEALLKIKLAFRSGVVDMVEATIAQRSAITLPDALTEFDVQLPSRKDRVPFFMAEQETFSFGADDSIFGERARDTLFDKPVSHTSALKDITLADESMDASMVARRASGYPGSLATEELLGRDDEFRFDMGEDWLMSPREPSRMLEEQPHDKDMMDIEVARRESFIGGNEPSIFDSGIKTEFGDKGAFGDGDIFGDGGLGLGDISMLGDQSAMRDTSHIEAQSFLGEGLSGIQFDGGLTELGVLQNADDLAWEQAEAEVLGKKPSEADKETRKKRKRVVGIDQADEETLHPISRLKEMFSNPQPLLKAPVYLNAESEIHPGQAPSSLGNLFSFPDELQTLFEKTKSRPTEYLLEALMDSTISGEEDGKSVVPDTTESFQMDNWDSVIQGASELGLDQGLDIPTEHEELLLEGDRELQSADGSLLLDPGSLAYPSHAPQLTTADISFGSSKFDIQLKSIMDTAETQTQPESDAVPLFGANLVKTEISEELPAITGEVTIFSESQDSLLAASGFSRSTTEAIQLITKKISEKPKTERLYFNEITEKAPKTDVVKFFFEVLVLKSRDMINIDQKEPFGDVEIEPLQPILELNRVF
ncbi:hypothetical protein BB558_002293 [Smittium angustum]|uniref:Rad21/Rec8-like protein N-terminal domain-containing protein n=1 Tax=Smittium angustum TaxID=133377 RepID=A0A2U1IVZ0_SMIAN|nr:hypothetical protein BB558_007091 [Smittium angustum]PVZ98239.1 hypothetical protein BB558_005752 [Smittium angustum]PWA01592.1 hypothetical protein BB558_002293 [Smittium angustum]